MDPERIELSSKQAANVLSTCVASVWLSGIIRHQSPPNYSLAPDSLFASERYERLPSFMVPEPGTQKGEASRLTKLNLIPGIKQQGRS